MRFFLPRLKSYRAKLTVVLILIVVILGGSSGGYYLYKNKSSAMGFPGAGTTITNKNTPLKSQLKGIPLSAGACNNDLDPIKCAELSGILTDGGTIAYNNRDIPSLIRGAYENQYYDVLDGCVSTKKAFDWFNTSPINSTKILYPPDSTDYKCTLIKKAKTGNTGKIQASIDLKSTPLNHQYIGSPESIANGTVNLTGSLTGKVDDLPVENNFAEDTSLILPTKYAPQFSGNVGGPFEINLNSVEHLDSSLNDINSAELAVNRTLSYWKLTTTGKIYGNINYANDAAGDFTITDFSICKDGCSIKNTEELNLVATKKATATDKFTGGIVSYAKHEETYSGSMTALKFTAHSDYNGMVKWNPDVQIIKTDKRQWSHKLKDSTNANSYYNYSGTVTSTAGITPFDKSESPDGYSHIISHIQKKFYSHIKTDPMRTWYTINDISLNKIEINHNGNLTRTGTGFRTDGLDVTPKDQWPYQKGIYDNIDDRMLVTEAKGYNVGKRLDIIGDYISPNYVKSYIWLLQQKRKRNHFFHQNSQNSAYKYCCVFVI